MKTEFLRRLLSRTEKLNKEHVVDVLLEVVEERDLMQLLFDTMLEGMVVIASDRSIAYVNETASRVLKITGEGRKLPLGKVFASSELLELCRAGIDREDTIRDREVTIDTDNGKRILMVNVLPLRNPQGRSQGVMMLFMDITEQRLQEAR